MVGHPKNLKKRFGTLCSLMVKWTPGDIETAVNAVNDGKMTIHKAEFTFGIPKSTLARSCEECENWCCHLCVNLNFSVLSLCYECYEEDEYF